MADADHLKRLRQGADAWNAWRTKEPLVGPDLREAHLAGADLRRANLAGADLRRANLARANLRRANLSKANLSETKLSGANLSGADLSDADLQRADLSEADLQYADLSGAVLFDADLPRANLARADLLRAHLYRADLSGVELEGANLCQASLLEVNLVQAHLAGADLFEANLSEANLSGADLTKASLQQASLVGTNLTNADLTGCRIYGVSAWRVKLSERTKQRDLVITANDEPEVTADNIEVAQFVYLLLHNEKIRDIIDTIGKKAVLILGRFTPERKAVLDALRDELRKHDYLPVLFDFDKPTSKDLTGTVLTLAHMARFIIADLTDPSCIPYEVSKVADAFVPVQPILLSGKGEFAMFADMQRRHHWVLATHRYDTPEQLIANLGERVIRPAEAKVLELREPPPR